MKHELQGAKIATPIGPIRARLLVDAGRSVDALNVKARSIPGQRRFRLGTRGLATASHEGDGEQGQDGSTKPRLLRISTIMLEAARRDAKTGRTWAAARVRREPACFLPRTSPARCENREIAPALYPSLAIDAPSVPGDPFDVGDRVVVGAVVVSVQLNAKFIHERVDVSKRRAELAQPLQLFGGVDFRVLGSIAMAFKAASVDSLRFARRSVLSRSFAGLAFVAPLVGWKQAQLMADAPERKVHLAGRLEGVLVAVKLGEQLGAVVRREQHLLFDVVVAKTRAWWCAVRRVVSQLLAQAIQLRAQVGDHFLNEVAVVVTDHRDRCRKGSEELQGLAGVLTEVAPVLAEPLVAGTHCAPPIRSSSA